MRCSLSYLLAVLFLCSALQSFCRADEAATTTRGDTSMFNGQDLSEWMGRKDLWSVKENTIVGQTSDDDPIDANTFLIWKGDAPEDFELTAWFKIEGGNSGIQYRSKLIDQKEFIVGGYQADIDAPNKYAGILYEEKGRGILAKRGQHVTIDESGEKQTERFGDEASLGNGIHPGQWNEYRIVAKGNELEHYINGTKTASVVDDQKEKSSSDGVIALQLHRGPAMTIRFKNLSLKSL